MDGREPTAQLVPHPRRGTVDRERIEAAVVEILRAIGEDPEREGLRGTPRRIAAMYAELFSGLHRDPGEYLRVGFEDEHHHEMVVLKDIPFYSLCEHHLLPFHGVAHVGYVPNGRIVGISKLARVVETLARRPQVQERLTSQIADLLLEELQAKGAAVVIEAEHLCMTMRGVKKPGSVMVTSAMRGLFRDDARTRSEFLSLIRPR
jgi:GTP cyclohydrolase I